MNKLLCIFSLLIGFAVFSQRGEPLEFKLSNPLPRVGEEVEFSLELDPIRDDFDKKIIGKNFKDKRFEEGKYPFSYTYSSKATYTISYKFKTHGLNDIPSVQSRYYNDDIYTQPYQKVWVDSALNFDEPAIYVRYRKIKRKHYLVVEEITQNRNGTVSHGTPYGAILSKTSHYDSTKFANIYYGTEDYNLNQIRETVEETMGSINMILQRNVFEIHFKKDTIIIDSNSFSDFPKGVKFEPLTIIKPQTILFKPIIKSNCEDWRIPIHQIHTRYANEVIIPDDSGYFEIEANKFYYLKYLEYYDDWDVDRFPQYYGVFVDDHDEDTLIKEYCAMMEPSLSSNSRKYLFRDCEGKPIEGEYIQYSSEGNILSKANYRKGKIVDSLFLYHFKSNTPNKLIIYKNRRVKRSINYWDNGNKKAIYNYPNGYPDMEMKFYENEQPKYGFDKKERSIYKNNKINIFYHENGVKMYELKKDTLFHRDENGTLKYYQSILYKGKRYKEKQYVALDSTKGIRAEIIIDCYYCDNYSLFDPVILNDGFNTPEYRTQRITIYQKGEEKYQYVLRRAKNEGEGNGKAIILEKLEKIEQKWVPISINSKDPYIQVRTLLEKYLK